VASTISPHNTRPVSIEEEMKRSYLDYAMSVIVSRALPDVRDGLKPVHRRILYAMYEAGNDYNKAHRKSARVIGDVMGKYHPHGDSAIYDAMVRLAQYFSLRLPLIDGQGNFGSMDGDPPAASRYTEARLAKVAHEMLHDLDQETVSFVANYDDSTQEPTVLPARFPNLLINGTNGIAVGMATNIPPHNLGEIIDGCCALVDDPDLDVMALMEYIPGPDFPTGGMIISRHGILEAYRTGRGSIPVRSITSIESIGNDREAIIVTQIPFQVNKARMVEKIAELAKEKIIEGISDLRDESDRRGVRVVIELKKDIQSDVVLNQLFRYSPMQSSFSCNMLALVDRRPDQLSLKQMLLCFIDFRKEVIVKRTYYQLKKNRERAHLLLGYVVAVVNMDAVIELIRSAPDRPTAKAHLLEKGWPCEQIDPLVTLVMGGKTNLVVSNNCYQLDEIQADAILDLRLHRLTGLERDKIQRDLEQVCRVIEDLLDILARPDRVIAILKQELIHVKDNFSTPRRTLIEDSDITVDVEDLIPREDMVITVSVGGYIKRVALSTYRAQKRGGRGRAGMSFKEEDIIRDVFIASTHSPVLFFTSLGKVYHLKTYRLPMGTPQAKGRAMVNLLPLSPGETVTTVLVLPEEVLNDKEKSSHYFLMFATSLGNVRRNALMDFKRIPSNGKRAMVFDEGERLVGVTLCRDDDDVMLFTKNGLCNRFSMDSIRIFAGRGSNGVRGIRLQNDDQVIQMSIIKHNRIQTEERDAYMRQINKIRLEDEALLDEKNHDDTQNVNTSFVLSHERFEHLQENEEFVLTITENGFGKRTSAYAYRTTNRGGQGYESIITNVRNGGVVAGFGVNHQDELMLITNKGQIIRTKVNDIRITGRRTQGVTLFKLHHGEKIVSASRIERDENSVMDDDIDDIDTVSINGDVTQKNIQELDDGKQNVAQELALNDNDERA
jgi:DNA gyrase subunit A